jgi:hypothetical protein
MTELVRRYGGLFGGIILAALLGGMAVSWMIGARGLPGPLLLLGRHVAGGAIAPVLLLLAMLTAVGIVVARLLNAAVALLVMGCGLGVLAMQAGGASDLAFCGAPAARIGAESVLWGVLLLPCLVALFTVGGMLPDVDPPATPGAARGSGESLTSHSLASAFSGRAWLGALAGLLAIPAAWIVLRNDLKGQALAAAVIGGLVAGTVGRLWSPRTQPILLVSATLVLLGLTQVVLSRMVSGPFADAFVRNTAPRLLRVAPVDLAAGVLAGVGLGLGWARSFMREPKPTAPADLRRVPGVAG